MTQEEKQQVREKIDEKRILMRQRIAELTELTQPISPDNGSCRNVRSVSVVPGKAEEGNNVKP